MRIRYILLIILYICIYAAPAGAQSVEGWYTDNNGVESVANIPIADYSQVVMFQTQAGVNGSGVGNGTVDSTQLIPADITAFVAAAHGAGKKALWCIKYNNNWPNAFAQDTAPGMVSTFATNITNFTTSNGFDGVTLDWEAGAIASQYEALQSALRSAMPTKIIEMTGFNDSCCGSNLINTAVAESSILDHVEVMCYDLDGGEGRTLYNDALTQDGNSGMRACDWDVNSFTNAGVPKAKIAVGIPFYGRRWPGSTLVLQTTGVTPSTIYYRNLVTDATRWQPQYRFYDSTYKSDYLSIPSPAEFDSFTGPTTIAAAVAWGKAQGYTGFFTFTLEYEYVASAVGTAKYPLSTALAAAVSAGGNANVYITSSGTGTGNCPTGANTHTPTFFNTSTNWGTGAGQIGPGTTVLLCGTFTATAGTCGYFSFQGSGTSGNPITLKWDTGAVVQAPYFCANHDSGAVAINGANFITIDGGTNGILQNTANGTGLANSSPSTLVGAIGASNLVIKNLAILNDYQRSGTDTVCAANNDWCSAIFGGLGGSNVTIGPGNTITWCDVCIHPDFQGGESNLRITGNTFSHYNQAIEMGPSDAGTKVITNVTVDNNTAIPSRDWDEPTNSYHHNFFHPFTNRVGSSFAGVLLVYNNNIVGDVGQHPTSVLTYFENSNGGSGCPAPCGSMVSPYVFNNIAKKTNTDAPSSTGMFVAWVGVDHGYLLNNTFVDAGAGGNNNNTWPEFNMTGASWTDENNIFVQGGPSYYFGNGNSTTNKPVADFNMYFSNPAGALWTWFPTPPGYSSDFPTWKTFCACDSHSVSGTDPALSSTLVPGPAAVFGTNLTTLAGTLGIPALLNDINGAPRGSGTWTVGAVNGGTGPPVKPNPPLNVLAVPN